MKTLHIVMILNFVVLATWGGWVYQTATQYQYQCTTDTECEEEELLIKEGKQS